MRVVMEVRMAKPTVILNPPGPVPRLVLHQLARGVSADELARAACVSRPTLWGLRRFGHATPAVAHKVAAALGLEPNDILGTINLKGIL
jgi:hypothetical protein